MDFTMKDMDQEIIRFNYDGNFKEESLTSVAFSPKIDLKSFSSGLEEVSLFGVTFPTNISPGLTSAPT